MSRFPDLVTAFLSRAGDVLFVQNPKGTSVGTFSGIAVKGLCELFSPALGRFKVWIDPQRLGTLYFIAAGVVIFNLPALFRRRQLPNSVEDAFEVIRRLKQEGASAAQIKLQYLALCGSVVEKVRVDFDKQGRKSGALRDLRERF